MNNNCNFIAKYTAKVTLSKQEWIDKTNEIISAVLMQVAGGSPLKTYDTKEDLDLAEPPSEAPENGYTGTRLVKTDEDGKAHWYYFKSDLKQWLDGGIYIAANLEEYCRTNGFYALLGAGYAAQLLSPNGNVISNDTFISRETYNGSSFGEGATVLRKIEGSTEKSTSVLKLNDKENTWQGLHYAVKDNIIKFDGNVSTNNLAISIDVGNVPPTPFTFYIDGEWVNNVNSIQIIKDSSGSVSEVLNSSKKSTEVDFTPIKIRIFFGVGTFNGEFKIMSVAGIPDVLPPFEPYYEGLRSAKPTKLVSTGSQIFNPKNTTIETVNSLKVTLIGNTFTYKGSTASDYGINNINLKTPIKLYKGLTYYIDRFDNNELRPYARAILNDNIETKISFDINATYTPIQDEEITAIILSGDQNTTYNDELQISISLRKQNEYKTYIENILNIAPEIQAINGYGLSVDVYDRKNNLVEVIRNEVDLVNNKFIRRVVGMNLNGIENWAKAGSPSSESPNRMRLTIPYQAGRKGTETATISNWKDIDFYGLSIENKEGITANETGIYINNLSISTVEELKSWLQANPIQINYILKEPEIIDLPVVQDNKILDYMHGTETWEGTQVPVPTEIGYLPDLINKLWDLLTFEQQKAIDDKQDERLTALENRINQLEARVTTLEPAPTFDEEVK